MIKKIINSYDIHINGQQLRVVERNELNGIVEGFDNIDLLLNEPRGSKYVNLFVYEVCDDALHVQTYSNSILDNKDILLKSFIHSLLDRGHINRQGEYAITEKGEITHYSHDDLAVQEIYAVAGDDGIYKVNGKKVSVEAVDFELSIENITELKNHVEAHEDFEGYLVLTNADVHVAVNQDKVILSYPVAEVVSVFNEIYSAGEVATINTSRVKVDQGRFPFQYYLISNSQFYIDDTDIYSKGFVIR